MLKNTKIFISGGTGVIGREMVAKLLEQGVDIFIGDLKPCPLEWSGKLRYRQGDLNFIEADEIADFAPDIFIHLAATFERSAESYEFWQENFWHNVRLSNYLMTIMKEISSLKKVVFASSYLIYDPVLYNFREPQEHPVNLSENDKIYPRNLTGMAKLAHEIELKFVEQFKSDQFKIVIARIFRGYGCGSRDIISRWVRSLLRNEEISVFKKEGWFDYIYSKDTADGLIRLALAPEASGIINLGTGRSKRVSDVLELLKNYFPQAHIKEENSDILYEASQCDVSKLIECIAWRPEYDIEKSIPEIIEFEKNKKNEETINFGNILISSASNKVPLLNVVKQAAAKLSPNIKVFAGDLNKEVATAYEADGFWEMPKTEEINIKIILDWCKKNNVKYIIPSRDGELNFWSDNKGHFSSHNISVMISGREAANRCLDKLEFSKYCLSKDIPAIPSYENIDFCSSEAFVVKERRGAGSISIGINLGYSEAKKHALSLSEPIFQPFIEGMEISVDAYVDKNNNVRGVILRRRDQVVNGESRITTTIKDEKIENIFFSIIKNLELSGHIILQAIIDKNNDVHVIECNCRFGGASTLSIKAGLDSFYWFLLESMGQDLKNYPFIKSNKQIKQVRVSKDTYIYGPNF